jgi:uncharacterized membrane-anchored protein YhcB (DUF1043 family)
MVHTEVNDIFDTPKGMFLQSGLDFYLLEPFRESFKGESRLLLSSVLVEGKREEVKWGEEITLENGQRTLQINYRLNKLLDKQTQRYQYRIGGLSEGWKDLSASEITLAELPYGTYKLEVRGTDIYEPWTRTEYLHITVVPLFYETAWFQALIFLLIGLFLGGMLWFGQKQYSKSLKRENLLLHTSMNSLKLQINPHFIFNALNSLQYFVVSDQKQKSTRFLSSFSQLVRDLLDSSLEKSSSVEHELKQIENYIDLERLRFEDMPLQFEITESLPYPLSEVYIPNMLLQPLVENAVWHGFTGSKRATVLTLNLEKAPNGNLLVEVIDNGVGIDLEMMKERQRTGSLAIRNIEERLYLLSKLHKKPHSITFQRLIEHGVVSGTKVSLVLPLQIQ